ncbi:hypothetical protein J6590_003953 [Homalodisca vitripennis]|nr:hypothetical protein J6590_003953 [Homalodisca vitripennis]
MAVTLRQDNMVALVHSRVIESNKETFNNKAPEERLAFNCAHLIKRPSITRHQRRGLPLTALSNCVTTEHGCYSATRQHGSTVIVSPQSLAVALRQDNTVALSYSAVHKRNTWLQVTFLQLDCILSLRTN